MKKTYSLILSMVICLTACSTSKKELKEGDIIFQTSQSSQSKFIAYATHSADTHCGIIVFQGSKPYVLEASNVIKVTPLDRFIGKGLLKSYSVYRYTEKDVRISYKKYLGIPYDSEFKWSDKRYYCSELVWKIYKQQLKVELCSPRKLSSYTTLGLDKILKRRGISKKELFVAPSDLSNSKNLYRIK